jgi:hypothetical protein
MVVLSSLMAILRSGTLAIAMQFYRFLMLARYA